jgi:hypothetical protein
VTGHATRDEAAREAARPAARRAEPSDDDTLAGTVGDLMSSPQAKAISKEIVRGVFGMLKKRF